MPITEMLARYSGIGISLAIDVVAAAFMTYFLYFRRHGRADLLLSYIALNLGIFSVMTLLTQVRVDIAVGFGLFAILSIIRLRSSQVTQQEVAYYFVALVLGLINGLNVPDRGLVVGLNLVLLVALAIFDTKALRRRARQIEVHLEQLFIDEDELVAELERLLNGQVLYQETIEINFINHHMTVDVRYRPRRGAPSRRVDEQTTTMEPVDATNRKRLNGGSGTAPSDVTMGAAADSQRSGHHRE
jgi:Domain of unknown function (DUF4956)